MAERRYQSGLIKRIKARFPGCIVVKNNPNYLQGVPDLLVLLYGGWAALEVKDTPQSPLRPNQAIFVARMAEMSFAAVIHPQNEEEVLDAIQRAFGDRRPTRVPKPEQLPLDQLR